MRNSPKVEPVEVNGKVIGFALSADFTSEHEWGVNKMKRSFNIPTTTIKEHVFEKHKNFLKKMTYQIPFEIPLSKNSENLYIVKDKEYIYLCSDEGYEGKYTPAKLNRMIYMRDGNEFGGAWDDSEFVIKAKKTKENLELFNMLIEAEKQNSIFIGFFPELMKKGLLILNGAEIPEDAKENYINGLKERVKMYEMAINSKVYDKLETAGKKWIYLEPSFIAGENGFHSAYNDYDEGTLLFWLNPSDQQNNASGYYSISELLDWAQNKGSVIERRKKEIEERAKKA